MKLPLVGQFCEPLTIHDGLRVGDRITFNDGGRQTLLTGVIRELYVEMHPSVIVREPEGSVFAEVDLVGGGEHRCWFRRDRPALAREIDGTVGAAPEGAMF